MRSDAVRNDGVARGLGGQGLQRSRCARGLGLVAGAPSLHQVLEHRLQVVVGRGDLVDGADLAGGGQVVTRA